ncbi:hypothetical protein CHARACLAT_010891, partial [Characodon lateralis]|nr:hypothetical protein [Characodon lateralis]
VTAGVSLSCVVSPSKQPDHQDPDHWFHFVSHPEHCCLYSPLQEVDCVSSFSTCHIKSSFNTLHAALQRWAKQPSFLIISYYSQHRAPLQQPQLHYALRGIVTNETKIV